MTHGLNTFRWFAFLAVFLFHVGWLQFGYLGVEAFFVLSGFLITPILLEMRSNLGGKDYFLHFYGRRALRIFPLYYFYLTLMAVLVLILLQYPLGYDTSMLALYFKQLPWALTYTYDFYHASNLFQHSYLLSHFWSLAVEEQFYLLWPLAIWLVNRRHINVFLLLVIFCGPLLRYLELMIIDASLMSGSSSESLNFLPGRELAVYVMPFSHLDAFAVGAYFALNERGKSLHVVLGFAGLVMAAGIMANWVSIGHPYWASLGYPWFMGGGGNQVIWGYSLWNLLFGLILVGIRDDRIFPVLFNNKKLDYLGRISYGLYVFHFPIYWLIYQINGMSHWLKVLTALAVTIMVSALSYEFVEKRFLNLKDRYFSKKSTLPSDRLASVGQIQSVGNPS